MDFMELFSLFQSLFGSQFPVYVSLAWDTKNVNPWTSEGGGGGTLVYGLNISLR